jgi:hypothetical protein
MAPNSQHADHLDGLTQRLRVAASLTPDLIADVVSHACARLPALEKAGRTAQIDRLIEASAWSDVALALIEIELPMWKLRRLIYEDGEWFCSLSKEPNLPVQFDDTADARHDVLPLAILSAFVEARRGMPQGTNSTTVFGVFAAFGPQGFGQTLKSLLLLGILYCLVAAAIRGEEPLGWDFTHFGRGSRLCRDCRPRGVAFVAAAYQTGLISFCSRPSALSSLIN